MKILTTPGVNLPPALIERYGILFTPAFINVDGALYENRKLDITKLEALIRKAKVHPTALPVIGIELVTTFADLTSDGSELILATASRELIETYDAGLKALAKVAETHNERASRISVVDTRGADIGAGLITLFCAMSSDAGKSREAVAAAALALGRQLRFYLVPPNLDYMAAGRRISTWKGLVVKAIRRRPFVAVVDGAVEQQTFLKPSQSAASVIAERIINSLGEKRKVWAAVAHGGSPAEADELMAILRSRLDVVVGFTRELAPAYYVYAGPGTLVGAALPIDRFPWSLPQDDVMLSRRP